MFTVRFVDWQGTVLKSEQVARGGSATAPAVPNRTGYTFQKWDTPFTNVTSDLTVTAEYLAIPPDNGSFTPDPKDPLAQLKGEGVPFIHIGANDVPLGPGSLADMSIVWSISNLILCIAGFLLAIFALVFAIVRKRRENEEENERAERAERAERIIYEQGAYSYRQAPEDDRDRKKGKKSRMVWLIVAIAMGVAGVIVFVLTENLSRIMVLFDYWTIVNCVILVIGIIATVLALKRAKAKKADKSTEAPRAMNEEYTATA